jgi:nitrate reductase NapE component
MQLPRWLRADDQAEAITPAQIAAPAHTPRRWREAATFVMLAVLVCPVVTVLCIGAYGFAFWTYFRFAGLPGPW